MLDSAQLLYLPKLVLDAESCARVSDSTAARPGTMST